jgi:uncharacterized protein (TIGR02186 family)
MFSTLKNHISAKLDKIIIVLLSGLILTCNPEQGSAEQLVTGISDDTIAIESNFVGADLMLFGTIERDANTVSRRQGYDIVVMVTGPLHDIVVRKKGRLAGIWVNRESHLFSQVPSYLAILSNRPLNEITTPLTRSEFQLGLDQLKLETQTTPEPTSFDQALVRLMRSRDLYSENDTGLEFLSDALFSARITVPAYVPVGKFRAEVFLFGDGALLQRQTIELDVHKSGFEQLAYNLATQQSLLYGLLAVAMAIFSGWLASVIFRKD